MAQKPYFHWVGSPNFGYPRGTHGRNGYRPIAIVDHIMAGTLAGTDAWFQNPSSQASAHFGVGKNGEIHQYVDIEDAAWHAGHARNPSWPPLKAGVNPNLYTVGIEHEGQPGDEMPEAQYQATLALHQWLIEELDIVPGPDTVIGHYRIDSVMKPNCPGPTFPWARLLADLAGQVSPYPDVPSDHWAVEAVAKVAEAGIMAGYPDGKFHGNDAVTRYQLAAALAKLIAKIEEEENFEFGRGEGTA